ncbi:serine--tRNA ligase [Alicyclobacillus acidoterrestris]|uniref:Serine--tRNA ligase n=1 Tax=Alicyclobacillus acidoterrestris (strain ATCC 49025 / DSM 3922 / CIP 106132 / NCIMB 13137 / GD3B) TaxID=1356854 RepID=T0C3T0_ALIAG|nr:serine--tRNA ligase [Alicyclobacillus acidoterrestris]EPZ50898.1 seryl-tRNA synthase [Alicyclobacillus acidoterrestris ATCC 49025]UNO49012.1 serine--tRNA ligase [Alicyclobacillus acidoterrestris]
MLDIRAIRQQPDEFKRKLGRKKVDPAVIDELLAADEAWRANLTETERLKNLRNTTSEAIARKKKNGEDATDDIAQMKEVGNRIKELDDIIRQQDERIREILLSLPNVPHDSVPEGASEDDNPVIRTWGELPKFDFEPKPHWEVAENLGILDIERAVKITGSRFVLYKGLGARLERALAAFMLDLHTDKHGYTEMFPAFIANEESLVGTGNLPKFGDEMFKLEGLPYYLIPTAEVPLTNYYRDEILSADQLPTKFAGYSSCFRSEAGSAGKDTRGLIRLHQFQKVELVLLVHPDKSYEMLEQLTRDCADVLEALELPYRQIEICTGDLGSKDAKKYDLEVWIPASNTYREISSCTNFEEFQARRANLRFRPDESSKPEFVHTLNGSGLAVGRTVAAILENNQQADGSVRIPKALVPYMGGIEVISAAASVKA